MRILAAIPHFFNRSGRASGDGRRHGSLAGDPAERVAALSACIASLHQLFGRQQCLIDVSRKAARPANHSLVGEVDVVVCTTRGQHLLERLALPASAFRHQPAEAEPLLLGFECHAVLREGLGRYDYFAYLEDDLITHDPWLFAKLAWFNSHLGDEALLQPNRFEVAREGVALKAYLDGDLDPVHTRDYQNLEELPTLRSTVMGLELAFQRASNPHSGCFFLNSRQMKAWADRPYFLDRDTRFIGPLESAASLGIMRTFRVYKPAAENASFLELEHFGAAFISQLRLRGPGE